MIEVSDAKVAIVHELGLITNINKFHNPQNNQVMYNITIISQGGTSTFPMNKELFEQWILAMNTAMNELNESRIQIPRGSMQIVKN